MWISIEEQLINLNHIEMIKWDESYNGDIVSLHLYPCERHNGKLQFNWEVVDTAGNRNNRRIVDLNIINRRIAKATNTMARIFKCDLADNSDDVIVQAVRDVGQRGEFIGE